MKPAKQGPLFMCKAPEIFSHVESVPGCDPDSCRQKLHFLNWDANPGGGFLDLVGQCTVGGTAGWLELELM